MFRGVYRVFRGIQASSTRPMQLSKSFRYVIGCLEVFIECLEVFRAGYSVFRVCIEVFRGDDRVFRGGYPCHCMDSLCITLL